MESIETRALMSNQANNLMKIKGVKGVCIEYEPTKYSYIVYCTSDVRKKIPFIINGVPVAVRNIK